jgi:5-methyltetrahydrofolate--homocysteine methyltransferase
MRYPELEQSVLIGDKEKVEELVAALIAQGENPTDIITDSLMLAMAEVGEKMKTGEMFIPEVIASADAMRGGMEIAKPHISGGASFGAKAVMGQVAGDVHNIGRKFVNMMLETAGFTVVDLGEDVSAAAFVEAVRREKPALLGLSALLSSTMPNMKDVVVALEEAGLRDTVRVIVGGLPVDQAYADSIHVDGYAADAISAIDVAKALV